VCRAVARGSQPEFISIGVFAGQGDVTLAVEAHGSCGMSFEGRSSLVMRSQKGRSIGRVVGVTLALALLTMIAAPLGAAQVDPEVDPLNRLDVLGVRTGDRAQILFAAPPGTTAEPLTGEDVAVQVDGRDATARLQRLPMDELDLAVVVDTRVSIADLRAIQGAIVQLALALPQGTSMRIADATGAVAPPAPVPGPAIAQIRQLAPGSGDDLQGGVAQAKAALDTSNADRGVLVVIGRELSDGLRPLGGRGFGRLHTLIDIGADEADQTLLGPKAAGDVVAVSDPDAVLAVTDRVSHHVANLYRATVDLPAGGAETVTLRVAVDGGEGHSRTLALSPDSIRPVAPLAAAAPDGTTAEAPADGGRADGGRADADPAVDDTAPGTAPTSLFADVSLSDVVLPALLAAALLIALAVVWLSVRLWRRLLRPRWRAVAASLASPKRSNVGGTGREETTDRRPTGRWASANGRRDHAPSAGPTPGGGPTSDPSDGAVDEPVLRRSTSARSSALATGTAAGAMGEQALRRNGAPVDGATEPARSGDSARRRRAADAGRPIAKLSPQTREALARAHRGLRRLALASRAVADSVPDDLFRLSEARASVALSRQDVDLDEVLLCTLAGDDDADVELVRRTAAALSTGWQHTSHRSSAPPPIIEINAVLTGSAAPGRTPRGPRRPVAPVRALNPLVEIGLEHVVLARHPDRDSELVARAVTTTDIMRSARLARPALTVSPWLRAERAGYRAALDADLNDAEQRDRWLHLLCDCIARAATESTAQLERLDHLRQRYRARATDTRMLPLVDLLLARPIVDVPFVKRRLSTSGRTANRLLTEAERAGWVRRDHRRTGTWCAEQVLSLFATDMRERRSQPA
jgi:hypothetical protein